MFHFCVLIQLSSLTFALSALIGVFCLLMVHSSDIVSVHSFFVFPLSGISKLSDGMVSACLSVECSFFFFF